MREAIADARKNAMRYRTIKSGGPVVLRDVKERVA
jgi:hypothetical protein